MSQSYRSATALRYGTGTRTGTIVDPITRVVKPAVLHPNGSITYKAMGRNRTACAATHRTWEPR